MVSTVHTSFLVYLSSLMTFQDEPRRTATARDLPDFDLTAVEVQVLLADPSGHGLSNHLKANASEYVFYGDQLKAPFRTLWYAENLGLTYETTNAGHRASNPIAIDAIVEQINRSAAMNGRREVTRATVVNSLAPLARALGQAFRIKLLINHREEQIMLLSEAWAANMLANMKDDAKRIFNRYGEVFEQCDRMGIDVKPLIAGTPLSRLVTTASN
jgi:hypothetical protein